MLEKLCNQDINLERVKVDDSEAIYHAILSSKAEISPWLNWLDSSYDQKSCDDFIGLQIINWNTDVEYTYTIKNKSNEILGMIGLHIFDSQNNVASIGYWMNTKFTSKGLCTKALKLLVTNALLPLNLIRIEVIVAISNISSQKVAIKSGGVFEAVLKNRIRINGCAVDANLYAFTPLT